MKPLWKIKDNEPITVCKTLLKLGLLNKSAYTRSLKSPIYSLPFESFHYLFQHVLKVPNSQQEQQLVKLSFQDRLLQSKICKNPDYPVGFINQNNNCFVISILQCLFAIDTFSNILSTTVDFDNTSSSSLSNKISIYKETSKLVKHYNRRKHEDYDISCPFPLDTIDIQTSLERNYPEYWSGEQFEAQQFLSR